ncbi:MAG TPA: PPOX class F420-dependent oxidoreductase [Longilinea sp.]|nr:PPOX class F420-dependent oxidoreductase [Longilinea sp.]
MNKSDLFDRNSYLNLETFRKSGIGVRTPVWFVEDGDTFFIRTDASSGKIKRIRNNRQVHIAPCKMDGALLGDWVEASARVIEGEEIDRKVDRLLGKKYGLMKTLFGLASTLQRRKNTIIEIRVVEQ